jgi:hypothetical protein
VSRLRRFLHIERTRAETPDTDPDAATARRFGGVQRPGAAPETPAHSGADLDRFAPPPPPSLELGGLPAGARPFTRCPRCAMDHHVAAVVCSGCGTQLDTAESRAFNDALWQERLAQAAQEAEAGAALQAAREEADAQAARDRRAMGEALAREVGEAERRRLDAALGPGRDVVRAGQRLIDWLLRGR